MKKLRVSLYNRKKEEIGFNIDENISGLKTTDVFIFNCSCCDKESSISVQSIKRKIGSKIEDFNIEENRDIFLCKKCKTKKTNEEKYGVSNVFQLDSIKDKSKKTMKGKYGVEYYTQSPELKEKIRVSNKEKYGVDHPMQTPELKERIKISNKEKYGVDHPMQTLEVRKKYEETMNDVYGNSVPILNEEIKNKIKNTNRERYGHSFFFSSTEYSEKIKSKMKEKISLFLNNNNLQLLGNYNIQRKRNVDENVFYDFKCLKCNTVFESHLHSNVPRCPKCFPKYSSIAEQEIKEFIKNLGFDVLENDRKTIGKELDILVLEKNLAIEFNGLYWHREQNGKDRKYHLNKSNLCKEKNIDLIHIFEDEWFYKKDIIRSIIKNKLGIIDNKIYARKCEIREISNKEAIEFYKKNHIQGGINSKINIGLYYNNELVSCLSFSKFRFLTDEVKRYEITRFANKLNNSVIGGFSKLLSFFKKNFVFSEIITYSDKRYFNGEIYKNNGFEQSKDTQPDYFYVRKSEVKRYNRMAFQKHKLSNLLESYNKDLTEYENMLNNGYDRIWGCGNHKFILKQVF